MTASVPVASTGTNVNAFEVTSCSRKEAILLQWRITYEMLQRLGEGVIGRALAPTSRVLPAAHCAAAAMTAA